MLLNSCLALSWRRAAKIIDAEHKAHYARPRAIPTAIRSAPVPNSRRWISWTRFCDLVMEGGIITGVVYPPAICALAKEYRFKNIGGTSAGAIAAAVTAGAELRHRNTNSMGGFDLLEALPELLGTKVASGDTQLFDCFSRTLRVGGFTGF